LQPALLRAEQRGVKLLRASRCPLGQMVLPPSAPAQAEPALPHVHLSPVKARIALALDLMQEA
jgi:L-asparaginase